MSVKRCEVVCDTTDGPVTCDLQLDREATIADALAAARVVLPEARVDWEHGATGVHGRVLARTHVPADGDRIELYRPLLMDPRASRRARSRGGLVRPKA